MKLKLVTVLFINTRSLSIVIDSQSHHQGDTLECLEITVGFVPYCNRCHSREISAKGKTKHLFLSSCHRIMPVDWIYENMTDWLKQALYIVHVHSGIFFRVFLQTHGRWDMHEIHCSSFHGADLQRDSVVSAVFPEGTRWSAVCCTNNVTHTILAPVNYFLPWIKLNSQRRSELNLDWNIDNSSGASSSLSWSPESRCPSPNLKCLCLHQDDHFRDSSSGPGRKPIVN